MASSDSPAADRRAVLLAVDGPVATITLNRPHRRNAVSWDLVTGLHDALDAVDDDPDIRVVVLTGAGGDFSVGADLARVGSSDVRDQETRTLRGRSVEDDRERLAVASATVERLVQLSRPTLALVTGACAGAGLSIALAADIRVASPRARFNTAFVSAGVAGDLGSAWLLTRAVGSASAHALMLDPRKLDAAQAHALGLVSEVHDDAEGRVRSLSEKLSLQSPMAMSLAKANLRDAASHDLPTYLRAEVPRMVDSARSDHARDAVRAYIAGRNP